MLRPVRAPWAAARSPPSHARLCCRMTTSLYLLAPVALLCVLVAGSENSGRMGTDRGFDGPSSRVEPATTGTGARCPAAAKVGPGAVRSTPSTCGLHFTCKGIAATRSSCRALTTQSKSETGGRIALQFRNATSRSQPTRWSATVCVLIPVRNDRCRHSSKFLRQ